MIKLQNISKIFHSEEFDTVALNGVNLEVKQGEFVAIMGPSGCGKSTLLNILGLIDTPTEGTYMLNGKDVSKLSESERTDIRKGMMGFVFQSFNLIDELNVNENTELPLLYTGVPARERKERVLEVLRRLNMSQRGKHFPSQLSGGQQQRVAIARAIINFIGGADSRSFGGVGNFKCFRVCANGRGSILLADEPTGNLDSKNGLEVMELLSQLNSEGVTIVMVTHSQHDATYANRIINLFDGQVVDDINDKL